MATVIGGERWMRIDTTAETTDGVNNVSPTWAGVRVRGGGFGLSEGRQTIDTEEQANTLTQPSPALSHFLPSGTVDIIPSPWDSSVNFGGSPTRSCLKFMLDAAINRTSNVLNSYTIQEVQNDIVTREFLGCKANGFTMGWSEGDGRLTMGVDWQGMSTGRLGTALGSGGAPTFPSSRDWLVRGISVEMGDQTGFSDAVTSTNGNLLSLQIEGNNNLTPDSPARWFPSAAANEATRFGVRGLSEGELSVTGSFLIRSEDTTWYDKYIAGGATNRGEIRILAFHPDSNSATVSSTADITTTDASDTDFPTAADPSSTFASGDVVYIEDHTDANPDNWGKEVLLVGSVDTNSITMDSDGTGEADSKGRGTTFDAQNGDTLIYSLGLYIVLPQIVIQDVTFPGGARDTVNQQVTFRAEIKGAQTYPIRYLVR